MRRTIGDDDWLNNARQNLALQHRPQADEQLPAIYATTLTAQLTGFLSLAALALQCMIAALFSRSSLAASSMSAQACGF
jgi:hypothetical protein